ncbi:MAG: inositol monophosphatase family protein [Promethearchaeota archaeon]
MEISINFLKQLSFDVYDRVHPLLGTKEASKELERGAGGDISMQLDIVAENIVIKKLENINADILLISEETGETYIGEKSSAIKNQTKLILDPIDGSSNAVRGVPYSSISIAFAIGERISDISKAVVLDLDTRDIYWAEKGRGAYLNDNKIIVSNNDISSKCIIEINVSKKNLLNQLNKYISIVKNFHNLRVMGSTALTLCQVARGSMDAFMNLRESNRLVDVAAGFLILKESGGFFFSKEGLDINNKLSIDLKFPFIASNAILEPFFKKELSLLSLK